MSVANSNNYDGRKYSFCPFEGGKGERYAEFDNDLRAHATSMPLDRDDDCDFEMALLGTDPGSLNHDGGAAANVRDPNALAAAPKRRWKSKQRQLYALYWKHVLIPSIRTRFKNECRNEGQRCFAIMEQEFRKVPDELDLSEIEKDRKTTFELGVHPDDLAAVVGSDGQVASALRMVLDACAYKHRTRASLVIREEPSQGGDSDDQEEAPA